MEQGTFTGRIMRHTGGFYYLLYQGCEIECRARGLFRKSGIAPCVGDLAVVEWVDERTGYLVDILPRKNALVRPSVANVDLLLMILSAVEPPPNLGVIDRLLAVCRYKNIDAAIVVTKPDMGRAKALALAELYRKVGYQTVVANALEGEVAAVSDLINGRLCVLSGNTGVGKSTLLNALSPALSLATGEISHKLGRGRHTTRTTQLFPACGGLIADTPGFSSLETIQLERIKKESLETCYIEFAPYLGNCRYTGCSHTKEKDCAVLEALSQGKIAHSRHSSYLEMYAQARLLKDWED